ncbi:ABC transporter permease [Lederbergia citrea]|uniref:ABC transporter permease n=1 Tax=Lederbergia citrea TaxID=2833581 RepID=A0A942UR18_9BACI|nr:ABC transporter permease [Lederbergia citrea]MBS4205979.1 ABC transporter permease [Lederbergia citrea]MBS4224572.1 ABC transporter permease [Lederbergia citrea]
MLNLIQNEWIKIFKQMGTYIMIGLLVLLVIGAGGITKYVESTAKPVNENWKEKLAAQNQQLQKDIEEIPMMAPSMKEYTSKQIAINDYRIKHDLPPDASNTVWTFINDSAELISFAGLFVIIIAAGIVANEFSWGTIKVLLIKPFHRWKILLSKYLTVVLFMLLMLFILFISASAVGAILFGAGKVSSNIHLAYVNGIVEEQNLLFYLMKTYLLNSLSIFLLATMAFMISAAFRVSGLAIGISIFLLLMGSTVTNLLASKFSWAKYSLFANTNLMQYMDGMPMVEGMTLSFSITVIIVYFLIFHILAFVFFTKRDIAA